MTKNDCFKFPVAEYNPLSSALVPHDPAENLALQGVTPDYGLKPNGVTIEDMRNYPELYSHTDDLDRAALAAQSSMNLSKDVRAIADKLQKLTNSKN